MALYLIKAMKGLYFTPQAIFCAKGILSEVLKKIITLCYGSFQTTSGLKTR
jgi:hypothetical protein